MPELPEVETTKRGIAPFLISYRIEKLSIYQHSLRWPIPDDVRALEGARVLDITRRGKYLLVHIKQGTAIIHLGMSGSLRICSENEPLRKHDHVELLIENGHRLRFHDPRRFGCFLWRAAGASQHALLAKLGPEPLSDDFSAETLFAATRKRRVAIKLLIMNSQVVVGVGNIYASEALFMSGIRPGKAAQRVTRSETEKLVTAIKKILQRSIDKGGTTLRDFVNSDGQPGYFQQSLLVYGRTGEPCRECGSAIKQKTMGQRSTFYCSQCQL